MVKSCQVHVGGVASFILLFAVLIQLRLPTVPKKNEFLDKSSININVLTVFPGRREALDTIKAPACPLWDCDPPYW